MKSYSNVLFGTGYTVDEDVIPSGWDLQSIDCERELWRDTHDQRGKRHRDLRDRGSASDVLDCTYTNRARGTIVVEKITDDGCGAFVFTSGTLTSPFTLTTTGAGAANKDSRTSATLHRARMTWPRRYRRAGTSFLELQRIEQPRQHRPECR